MDERKAGAAEHSTLLGSPTQAALRYLAAPDGSRVVATASSFGAKVMERVGAQGVSRHLSTSWRLVAAAPEDENRVPSRLPDRMMLWSERYLSTSQAFEFAREARVYGAEAREVADLYFFDTVVRVPRRGEGAPHTGLKPAVSTPARSSPNGHE